MPDIRWFPGLWQEFELNNKISYDTWSVVHATTGWRVAFHGEGQRLPSNWDVR